MERRKRTADKRGESFVSPAELAALLGYRRRNTIYEQLARCPEELPPFIRINSWTIRFYDVDKWLRERTAAARVANRSRRTA